LQKNTNNSTIVSKEEYVGVVDVPKEEEIMTILNKVDDETKQIDKIKKVDYKENTFFYKNYRRAMCLNCKKQFDMNFKQKYYCFWGLICYKTVNNYRDKF